MTKGAQELKDLDVDRVDGVDKPATGRNFLLFKSEDGDAIMKGYGMVATAAHAVLAKMRTDKNAQVSRKSAIALNGLAQVLGEDAVFVGKSVPTQPYLFTEPDADKRGPADENVGGNFTPRSMPGSMVGSVQFRLKDEEEDEEDSKRKARARYDEDEEDSKRKMKDEEEEDAKGKRSSKARAKDEDEEEEDSKRKARAKLSKDDKDGDDDDDDMDASERSNRGVARSIKAMTEAIAAQTKAINKAMGLTEVRKDEDEDKPKPRSRQIEEDEPVRVRKSSGYEPKFGTDFTNIVFGGK